MEVEWTVAGPGPGLAVPSPTRSDAEAYRNRLTQLVQQRWGYSEVWEVGTVYPTITLSISNDLAVVHRFIDAEACFLLDGEDVVPADKFRYFSIQDAVVSLPVTSSHHQPAPPPSWTRSGMVPTWVSWVLGLACDGRRLDMPR